MAKTKKVAEDDVFTPATAHGALGKTKASAGLAKSGLSLAQRVARLSNAASKASQLVGKSGKMLGHASALTGVLKAAGDVKTAIESRSKEDALKATNSTAASLSGVLSVGVGAVQSSMATAQKEIAQATTRAMKGIGVSSTLAKSVADDVAKVSKEAMSSGKSLTSALVSDAARGALERSGASSTKAASGVLAQGGKAASQAVAKATATSTASILAKAGGRFVPGANIAIAALDATKLATTLADPNASTTKKVASAITALGSAVAATNIPIVSQGGAIVSAVSSFAGAFFG